MYTVKHGLRIRITGEFKLMASPRIKFPIVPVLYNIVYRNVSVTELFKRTFNILTALITLTALPKTQSPFREDLRFAR